MGINGETLQLHAVYKKKYIFFYYKSCECPYQYYKSHALCLNVQGSYDKVIITIVPSYTGKNITCLLPLALLLMLRTRNKTDGA